MAIDVCSDIASPRISFSYDLNQTTDGPRRLDSSLLDSDFHFCFNNTKFFQEISPADQLFSNGKILPVFYDHTRHESRLVDSSSVSNKTSIPSKSSNLDPPMDIGQATSEKKLLKEFLTMGIDQVEEKPINGSKSFWKFKRSNSLNCETCTKSKGLIKSLQFLSRSNSTGSAPKPHNLQRQASVSSGSRRSSRSSSVSGSGSFYPYPVLRKCGSYGNGASSVRVSPVLNIPPPCISRGTVTFFVSLFCSGKDKKKKK